MPTPIISALIAINTGSQRRTACLAHEIGDHTVEAGVFEGQAASLTRAEHLQYPKYQSRKEQPVLRQFLPYFMQWVDGAGIAHLTHTSTSVLWKPTLKFSAVFGTASALSSMTIRPSLVASAERPSLMSKKTLGLLCAADKTYRLDDQCKCRVSVVVHFNDKHI